MPPKTRLCKLRALCWYWRGIKFYFWRLVLSEGFDLSFLGGFLNDRSFLNKKVLWHWLRFRVKVYLLWLSYIWSSQILRWWRNKRRPESRLRVDTYRCRHRIWRFQLLRFENQRTISERCSVILIKHRTRTEHWRVELSYHERHLH